MCVLVVGRLALMNDATYSVKLPDGRYLGTTALSPIARPLPARFRWRGGKNAAEVAAAEWGGTVVAG
jgi:hypothetical protein